MTTIKIEADRKKLLVNGLLLAGILFYLFSAFSRIGQPIAKDDLHWLLAAKNLIKIGRPVADFAPDLFIIHSPHSYLYAVKWAFDLFGMHEPVARLPGILSGVVTILLLWGILKNLTAGVEGEKNRWAGWMTLLYAATPATIQGSLILDNDNTFLVPATLFLFFSFLKYQQEQKLRWAVAACLAVTTTLWVRLTTPAIALVLLWFFALISKTSFKSKCILSLAIVLGILAFVGEWFVYCKAKDLPFLYPFQYTLDRFLYRSSGQGGFRIDKIFLNLVYLTLWVGPFTVMLFLILAARRLFNFLNNRQIKGEDYFLIGALVLVGTYLFVGGVPFGFPKYQLPGIILMYVFGALALNQSDQFKISQVHLKNILIVMGAAFLIQILILHDPLYLLRYQLREAAASFPPLIYQSTVRAIVLKTVLYFSLSLALGIFLFKSGFIKNFVFLLTLFAMGSNLGINWLQNIGGYQTGYDYGIRGTVEAARFIRSRVPHLEPIVVPSELVYYLDYPGSSYLLDRVWNDPPELMRIVSEPEIHAFAYSIAISPVDQIKNFTRYEPLDRLLNQDFDPYTVGSFKIWIRK